MFQKYCRLLFFVHKIGDFGKKTGGSLFTKISIMQTKLNRWWCKYYIVYRWPWTSVYWNCPKIENYNSQCEIKILDEFYQITFWSKYWVLCDMTWKQKITIYDLSLKWEEKEILKGCRDWWLGGKKETKNNPKKHSIIEH